VLTDGRGVPVATIVTAATSNDHTALPELLDARIASASPRLERPGLWVDAADDNAPTEQLIRAADDTPHLRRRGEARPPHDPRVEPRRWPVERTHPWPRPTPGLRRPWRCTMRKLIVANIMSLDGYVAGPGDNVMALPMEGFFDEHNLERLRAADTLLLGATTYMGLKAYWPAVAEHPELSPAVAKDPRSPTCTARQAGATTRSRRSSCPTS
jgi:hypothetical protein